MGEVTTPEIWRFRYRRPCKVNAGFMKNRLMSNADIMDTGDLTEYGED